MNTTASAINSIPIHCLGDFGFCEYSLYLKLVKGFTPRPTNEMLQGTQAHARINAMSFVTRDSIISIEDALIQAETVARETIKRNVRIQGQILYGTADEIYIGPKEITVIDDKPRAEIQQSYVNQVFGYCLAFKEKYNPKQPMYGAIRNHRTGKEIWRKQFSSVEEEYINGIVRRILGIIREDIIPKATAIPEVCRSCRFKYYCEVRSR